MDLTSYKLTAKTLILVMDESSRKILAAQIVTQSTEEHEFNRLLDHFQFGGTDGNTLQPISQTFALQLKRPE